jgi:cobalamin synthase
VFALKAAAIASLSGSATPALLFAPMLGRWAMVVCAYGARDAARPGTGAKFHRELGFREFGWTSALALGLLLGALEAVGVAVAVAAASAAVALRLFWHRRRGGVSWEAVGATGEAVEATVLLVLAAV